MGPQNNEPILDDDSPSDAFFDVKVNGEVKGRGHDPSQVVKEMFAPPSDLPLIPRSEWSARIKEQEERKSRTSDLLLISGIPSMDQGPNGYCWTHSVTGAAQVVRAMKNLAYVPLSAYMIAAIIKGGRNEGGWCGLAAKFMREHGVCSQALWPQGNRSLSLDTPECRADAALRKTTEEWADLTRNVYDQNLTFDMVATCLLSNIPVAGDFNHWSHSVLLCDLVEVEPGSFGVRLRNSWSDSWGDKGFGILRGSKAITDGAIALRSTGISPK